MNSVEGFQPRVAWGITGAGHYLPSCVDILLTINSLDIFLSKAAEEVLSSYGLYNKLKNQQYTLLCDDSASYRSVTKLYTGKYNLVVIAPVTSNSIAKMANGIADNLVTNLFAHAGKCRIPIVLFPCDSFSKMKSLTPKGEEVSIYGRDIDRQNIQKLASWDGVLIATDSGQLKDYLKIMSNSKKILD